MMRSTSNNRIRKEIALEAAKLVANDGLEDYLQAKKKAASQLGIHDNRMLPSNSEIETALVEYQSLFKNKQQPKKLLEMRNIAFRAMLLFKDYNPRLTGSVLHGTADQYSEITLHIFCDTSETIGLFLENEGIPATLCERRLQLTKNNPVYFSTFKFLAGEFNIVIIVLPCSSIKMAPIDPVTGKPMNRAKINDVKKLIHAS